VHFVLMALERSKGGEIFVPSIPSMKITDLAKAIGPQCKHEVVGIRPGEKVHETLLSEDEARNTIQFKEYFIVQSSAQMRDQLMSEKGKDSGKLCEKNFHYSSDSNAKWMTVSELKVLVDEIENDYSIEKSRWSTKDVPE